MNQHDTPTPPSSPTTSRVDAAGVDTVAHARADEWPMPDQIGEFRILGLLGRGGMGAVYRAEQQQPHREVALKVLRGGSGEPDLLRRFRTEGEALALLDHPNIAHVFATGVDTRSGHALPYLAMEYVRGETLLADANTRGLTTAARIRQMIAVCAGVAHAHQRGVIHRDLKPANILVDDDGRPKIMDFGIARIVADGTDATRLTEAGQVVGTIPYMSPEQLRGETAKVDVRTDVFALGVILYELLCGERPRHLDATSLFSAIRSAERTPMQTLAKRKPAFAGDLDTIVMKALAETPDERYGTVAAFAADLERFLDDRPIEARPASALYTARKFARRHRAFVAAAAVVAIALIAATAFSLYSAQQEREARAAAERNAAIAESVSQFMNDMFSAALPEEALGREVTVRDIVDQAQASLKATPPKDPEVAAQVGFALAQVDQALGRYDHATAVLTDAMARAEGDSGVDAGTRFEMRMLAADLAGRKSDYTRYESLARGTLEDIRRTRPGDLALELKAENELAAALFYLSRNDEAESLYRDILARVEALPAHDGAALKQEVISDLGTLVRSDGRIGDAKALFTQGLADARRIWPEQHPLVLTLLNHLGTTEQLLGDLDAAARYYQQAYDGRIALYGQDHPETMTVQQNLANVMVLRKQYDAALPILTDLYDRSLRIRGPAHPNTDIAANAVAWVYEDTGRLDEAEALYARMVEAEVRQNASFIESFGTENNYAMLLMKRGKLADAARHFEQVIARLSDKVGDQHPYVAIFRNNYGECLTKMGRYDEALKELRTSHDGLVSTFGADHDRVTKSAARIAAAERRGG